MGCRGAQRGELAGQGEEEVVRGVVEGGGEGEIRLSPLQLSFLLQLWLPEPHPPPPTLEGQIQRLHYLVY